MSRYDGIDYSYAQRATGLIAAYVSQFFETSRYERKLVDEALQRKLRSNRG